MSPLQSINISQLQTEGSFYTVKKTDFILVISVVYAGITRDETNTKRFQIVCVCECTCLDRKLACYYSCGDQQGLMGTTCPSPQVLMHF